MFLSAGRNIPPLTSVRTLSTRMSTLTPQRDPERLDIEPEPPAVKTPFDSEPLHVVPPTPAAPVRIRSRYGELEEHELLHMLDSIEDELARRRFRESLYISFFLCVVLAWMVLYGPTLSLALAATRQPG